MKDTHSPRPRRSFISSRAATNLGCRLLRNDGSSRFSSIYLVDIWMGIGKNSHSLVPDFYKALVNKIPEKITYVYTSFGTNNSAVRDYIAASWARRKRNWFPVRASTPA